jgi:hypothetical protein
LPQIAQARAMKVLKSNVCRKRPGKGPETDR